MQLRGVFWQLEIQDLGSRGTELWKQEHGGPLRLDAVGRSSLWRVLTVTGQKDRHLKKPQSFCGDVRFLLFARPLTLGPGAFQTWIPQHTSNSVSVTLKLLFINIIHQFDYSGQKPQLCSYSLPRGYQYIFEEQNSCYFLLCMYSVTFLFFSEKIYTLYSICVYTVYKHTTASAELPGHLFYSCH